MARIAVAGATGRVGRLTLTGTSVPAPPRKDSTWHVHFRVTPCDQAFVTFRSQSTGRR
jgi:hypothetical protein